MRTRVKICGITSTEQARWVADSGADALGLVFYERSPRAVSITEAAAISQLAAPLLSVVALFVNATAEHIERVLAECAVDQLQFHGDETPAFCARFGRPYIRALRMRPELDVLAAARDFAGARALLLDSYRAGVAGGTGETFAWERIPVMPGGWLLAGGLNADNVGAAIQQLKPPAVDVSGGVERAPGSKDPAMIKQFMEAVHAADSQRHEDAA